jgi:hypothetical protein
LGGDGFVDDMAGKISELLNDPGGIERIMNMARALFSDGGNDTPEASPEGTPSEAGSFAELLPEGFDPIKLMNIFSAFNSQKSDNRTALLLALKPHLSEIRQERVEKAVKLLKIASLIPLLKDQGLLDMI